MVYQICLINRYERLVRISYHRPGDVARQLVGPIFKGLQLDWTRSFAKQYDSQVAQQERDARLDTLVKTGVPVFYNQSLKRNIEFSPETLERKSFSAEMPRDSAADEY
jgi:hypothetical protein